MAIMHLTRIERVYRALKKQKPDRVPYGEFGIENGIAQKLLFCKEIGLEERCRLYDLLDWDFCVMGPDTPTYEMADTLDISGEKKLLRDIYGNIGFFKNDRFIVEKYAVSSVHNVLSYKFGAVELYKYESIRQLKNMSDIFIFGLAYGPFQALARFLMSYETFYFFCGNHLPELTAIAQGMADFQTCIAIREAQEGANAIFIPDDLAGNSGPLINPKLMREIFFPIFKRQVDSIRKAVNIPIVLHSCGDIRCFLDDIVELGFDGLQGLQPNAGMDLAAIARHWGKHLCLIGNIDTLRLMPEGNVQEVRQAVRETIKAGIQAPGFMLSTSNIIMNDAKMENVFALRDAAREYGVRADYISN